jgi:macrodomain Ter protein organizer (MatP/YcbG family)
MARPIKTFSTEEAMNLIRQFWLKSRSFEWIDFEKNLRIDPALTGDSKREQLTKISNAAKLAIEVLMNAKDKEAAPAAIRAWIDTYLSETGWKRIQAAQRQKKSAGSNRNLLTKMEKESSWDFSHLAKEAGLSKKDYLSQLAGWMLNDKTGQQAAASFSASRKAPTEKLRRISND